MVIDPTSPVFATILELLLSVSFDSVFAYEDGKHVASGLIEGKPLIVKYYYSSIFDLECDQWVVRTSVSKTPPVTNGGMLPIINEYSRARTPYGYDVLSVDRMVLARGDVKTLTKDIAGFYLLRPRWLVTPQVS